MRIPLFSTCVALNVAVIGNSHFTLGIPLLHTTLFLNYAHIAICVISLTTDRPKVHAALALAYLLVFSALLLRMVEPDSLFRMDP